MDNVTHAALGIAAGVVAARRGASLPAAALCGLLAAEAPDLDIFLRNADDPLVAFRWHRHFTHSFAFMPIWAFLAATLTGWLFRHHNGGGWKGLMLPALFGTFTHLICDNCTSYGTMLFWPFNEQRYAWDCLPIIDFVATLPVLVLALLAWKKHSHRLAWYGLLWFSAYALAGAWQHHQAERSLRGWLTEQKIAPERLAVKPTISNLIVWRAIWSHDGVWQVAAVRVMPFTAPQLLLGETRAVWSPQSAGNPPETTVGGHAIHDFSVFTQGWNTYDKTETGLAVGDIRFAMLPTSSNPLWTLQTSAAGAAAATQVKLNRDLQDGDWGRFGRMLNGSDPHFITLK